MKLRILATAAVIGAAAFLAPAVQSAPASAATATCVDQASNANCTGQYPGQANASGISCLDDAYPVPYGNSDVAEYSTNGWVFFVTLWYSRKCQSNWASVSADGVLALSSTTYSAKVRRYAGPDGPYLMEHGGTNTYYGQPGSWGPDAISPMVWSPDNLAQACLSLPPYSGTPDQIACTQEW